MFLDWAAQHCPDAAEMNIGSDPQKQTLLFAPAVNEKNKKETMPAERLFEVDNVIGFKEPKKIEVARERWRKKQDEEREPTPEEDEEIVDSVKAKKKRPITLYGMGIPALKYTAKGWPAVSNEVLQALAGDNIGRLGEGDEPNGTAFEFFGGGEAGTDACKALDALCQARYADE
jgi:DNA polymerase-1